MSRVPSRAKRAALGVFRRLPRRARLGIVHTVAPTYSVGAVAVIWHGHEVLFLRQGHRKGWSLPGGLLDRGEDARTAVVREVAEETGLQIRAGLPTTCNVNPKARHLDVVFEVFCDERPAVSPGSEAHEFAWIRPADLDTMDMATLQIVTLIQRVQAEGSRSGRLVAEASDAEASHVGDADGP